MAFVHWFQLFSSFFLSSFLVELEAHESHVQVIAGEERDCKNLEDELETAREEILELRRQISMLRPQHEPHTERSLDSLYQKLTLERGRQLGNVYSFTVNEGRCSVTENGRCVVSPNYPNAYGNYDTCSFSADGGNIAVWEYFLAPQSLLFCNNSGTICNFWGLDQANADCSYNMLCNYSAQNTFFFQANTYGDGAENGFFKLCLSEPSTSCALDALDPTEQQHLSDVLLGLGVDSSDVATSDGCSWTGVTCSRRNGTTHVINIDLTASGLSGSLSSSIGHLQYLTWLSLPSNNITGTIPSSIGNLKYLSWLDLSMNEISGCVPPSFGASLNLDVIRLSSNLLDCPIDQMSALLKNPKVRNLYMSDNLLHGVLTEQRPWICPVQRYLDISNNFFQTDVTTFLKGLASYCWGSISARDCGLKGDLGDFITFETTLMQMLDLRYNSIESISSKVPATLSTVQLDHNALTRIHDSWWNCEFESWMIQISALGNPNLRANIASPSKKCSDPPLYHTLIADPEGFVEYDSFQCTSLCNTASTSYKVNFTTNESSLCFCKVGWEGPGTQCSPCREEHYGVGTNLRFGLNKCQACPANSSTFGKSSQTKLTDCLCSTGSFLRVLNASYGTCSLCSPGKFTDAVGTIGSCMACERGSVAGTNGSSKCMKCPAATYADSKRVSCIACPSGTFQSNEGSTLCTPCFPGTYSFGSVKQCLHCPRGTYQHLNGTSFCVSCDHGFETVESGASSKGHCTCPPNKTFDNSSNSCISCPQGAECNGGLEVFNVSIGYFSTGASPSSIFKCASVDKRAEVICAGGHPLNPRCRGDRIGFLCQHCPEGYIVESGGGCYYCTTSDLIALVLPTLSIVAVIAVVVTFLLKGPLRKLIDSTEITGSIPLALNFLQILAAVQTLGLDWTDPFHSVLHGLSFFSIDLDVIHIRCLTGAGSANGFFFQLAIPLAAVLGLALLAWMINKAMRREVLTSDIIVNFSGRIFLVCYISICLMTITAFHCYVHPNGRKSLVAFPEVLCWETTTHTVMIAFTILAILIYVVGLFAVIGYIIWQYPKRIADGSLVFINHYDFVFSNWRPERYWFSAFLLVRNLIIAALPRLISPEFATVTLVLMQSTLIIHLCFLIALAPWCSTHLNNIDVTFSVILQFILGSAVISNFRRDYLPQISICVLTTCAILSCFGAGYLISKIRGLYARSAATAFHICHHKAVGASTARFLKTVLIERLQRRVVLSTDFGTLADSFESLKTTDCLIVLLTGETLCRPCCAGELVFAVQLNIPLVPITVGSSPVHVWDVKDQYQKLNQTGLKLLYRSFHILGTYYIDLTNVAPSFEQLLTQPSLHLNISSNEDIKKTLEVLDVLSRSFERADESKSNRCLLWKACTAPSPTTLVRDLLAAAGSQQILKPPLPSQVSFDRKASMKLAEAEHTGAWLILSDADDFEAIAAARILKQMLHDEVFNDLHLDFDLTPAELKNTVGLCSVFLVLLSNHCLSSAVQLSRLALVTKLLLDPVLTPIRITETFRCPNNDFYENLSEGQYFGPEASTLFSRLAGQELTCRDIVDALKLLLQTVPVFLDVSGGDQQILKREVANLAHYHPSMSKRAQKYRFSVRVMSRMKSMNGRSESPVLDADC